MSMLSHLSEQRQQGPQLPETIKMLYSTRLRNGRHSVESIGEKVLFIPRINRIFGAWNAEQKKKKKTDNEKRNKEEELDSDGAAASSRSDGAEAGASDLSDNALSSSSSPSLPSSSSHADKPATSPPLPPQPQKIAAIHLTDRPENKDRPWETDWLGGVRLYSGRFTWEGLSRMLGTKEERGETVVYVCGPKQMIEEVVGWMEDEEKGGMRGRVLSERWW